MTLRDPWQRLSTDGRRRTFFLGAAAAIGLTIALGRIGAPLKTPAAPDGIISFELAGSRARAGAILASWDVATRDAAQLSLVVDYVYLIAYPLAISLGCALVAGRLRPRRPDLATVALALSWAVLVAGVLDAIENAALLRQLAAGPGAITSRLAQVAALAKFALVAASLPCALLAFLPDRTKA